MDCMGRSLVLGGIEMLRTMIGDEIGTCQGVDFRPRSAGGMGLAPRSPPPGPCKRLPKFGQDTAEPLHMLPV